jgi:aldose 1-epimerase
MADAASGAQFELSAGQQRATVVEVGGGLRTYTLGDWSILDGYAAQAMCDGGRGQPLLPWPNRLGDGRYAFEGREYQLPIDEVSASNAIHGLTRWLNWHTVDQQPDRLTMALTLHSRPGYPFPLDLRLTYRLADDGLAIHTEAINVGSQSLPFGAGFHPYYTVGTPLVDAATLRVPASHTLELDGRGLPTGRLLDVANGELDFRVGRPIDATRLDTCFTNLERDTAGNTSVELAGPDGRHVEVWMDGNYRWLMVYSGETLAPARRRQGLAVEPMTCPPNAYRSGDGLRVLEPGEAFRGTWGIRPRLAHGGS